MITLALTYYEAPRMLAEHMRAFEAFPPGVRLVLVDDGSTTAPADLNGCAVPYELWRMTEDRPWHQNAARNIAMHRSHGPTILTDIDHLLTPAAARAALAAHWPKGVAYRPRRIWPDGTDRDKRHPNSYIINPGDYWAAGGYDETFCGYYGTDAGFRRQLANAGVTVRNTDALDLTLYESVIEDATADLPRKGSRYHARGYAAIRRRLTAGEIPGNEQRFLCPFELVAVSGIATV